MVAWVEALTRRLSSPAEVGLELDAVLNAGYVHGFHEGTSTLGRLAQSANAGAASPSISSIHPASARWATILGKSLLGTFLETRQGLQAPSIHTSRGPGRHR
jgi:hypothetical protein